MSYKHLLKFELSNKKKWENNKLIKETKLHKIRFFREVEHPLVSNISSSSCNYMSPRHAVCHITDELLVQITPIPPEELV